MEIVFTKMFPISAKIGEVCAYCITVTHARGDNYLLIHVVLKATSVLAFFVPVLYMIPCVIISLLENWTFRMARLRGQRFVNFELIVIVRRVYNNVPNWRVIFINDPRLSNVQMFAKYLICSCPGRLKVIAKEFSFWVTSISICFKTKQNDIRNDAIVNIWCILWNVN